jgi:hypothetical protein
MKQEIIIGYRNGEPIIEEGVLIKTADPSITGRIFEIDGKYFVRGKTDEIQPKWFNRLSEAIQYCQPKKYSWS